MVGVGYTRAQMSRPNIEHSAPPTGLAWTVEGFGAEA